MPDTGAPWNIPYVESSDLVSDWPTDSLALANAIDSGLDAARGLVAVKHALFTGTQTNSTAAGANFAVTDLSITHTLADSANKILLMGYFGQAANAGSSGRGMVGIAFADDGTLIGIGDAGGASQSRTAAGGIVDQGGGINVVTMPHIHLLYEPGDTSEHIYTLRAINLNTGTSSLYINRSQEDANNAANPRAVSGITLMEVKV